jgi:hypothetical protein
MTVRAYETKFCPCEICCEPNECTIPSGGIGLQISVEGGAPRPFAVCESCVRNMAKPFPPDPNFDAEEASCHLDQIQYGRRGK